MMKTTTVWKTKHEFESHHDQSVIKIDGNNKNGFGPKALLTAGLASCSGIDVVDILEKMKVKFSSLVMEVETKQSEEHPRVFIDILINYTIKTDEANMDKIKKAIDLSLDKYCGVSAMLKKSAPIRYNIVIER